MATIRTVQYETDAATGAKAVLDIREFDAPATLPGRRHSLTAASRDAVRRALLADLSAQIDDLLDGRAAEIVIVLN